MSGRHDDLGLEALLAAERAADDAPGAAAAERIHARVMASVVPPPPPGGAAHSAGGVGGAVAGGAKLWLAAGLLAVGGLTAWQITRPDPAPPPRPRPAAAAPSLAPSPPPSAPASTAEPTPAPAAAAPSQAPPAAPTSMARRAPPKAAARRRPRPARRPAPAKTPPAPLTDADLAAERRLLGRAAAALQAGRGAEALGLVRQHRARFARGRLVEERDVFEVRALAALGRPDEARAAAQRFLRRYPKSLHRATVQAAMAQAVPP